MAMAQIPPRAFTIGFRSLATWSVAAQFAVDWNWPGDVIKPLQWVLSRRSETALETLKSESLVTLLTIRFNGSIEPREPVQINDIKGKLFRVYPGDVVFSKIDVRNGAIGLAPDDIDCMCVTSEFPVYYVNTNKALSEYVKLLFRTAAFKKVLNSMISGTSGRKRIQPSQLEGVEVPFPPLPFQQKVVSYWKNALSYQQLLLAKKENIRNECRNHILDSLGIKRATPKKIGKLFCLNWAHAGRWSYEFNKRVLSGLAEVRTGQYKAVALDELCKGQSGSTPFKKNLSFWRNGDVPWVSPKDMKVREIHDAIDHITSKAVDERQAPTVPNGSILFVVRSGILQKIVPVAITRKSVSINQDMRAFTPRDETVFPNYLLAYFEAKQEELLRLVKWSTTVQSINKEDLESFPVPLPPINIQKKIVSAVNDFEAEINNCEAGYQKSILSAHLGVEQMILGTRTVENI